MRMIKVSLLIMALCVAVSTSAAASRTSKPLLLGVSYLPQVTCVEDFSPYWITDNWTQKRMVNDLKIMKALGCSGVRFHIAPASPENYKIPGVDSQKVVPMMDLAVNTAEELQLRVHIDISGGEVQHGEEGVKLYVSRFKGKVESYQIGNEQYGWPKDPERMKWLHGLVELAKSIDPNVKVSADMLVPDWVKVRNEMPDLYRSLDMGLAHYYPVTDYRGWNDIYLSDILDHLGNKTGRRPVMEQYREMLAADPRALDEHEAESIYYDHPLYAGSWAWLDKEVWITETSAHGYWRWGNLTPEKKRADDWRKLVDAIAAADNKVTRIYHHCMRDKMSWREYGMGQSGLVYYDGSPRQSSFAFREMAVKHAPADSALKMLSCDIKPITAPYGVNEHEVAVTLTNLTNKPISGKAELELPDGVTSKQDTLEFTLAPKERRTWKSILDLSGMYWGNNHIFAKVNFDGGLIYGWGIAARPKKIEVDKGDDLNAKLSGKVQYVKGFEAVEEFFEKYGDRCAIVTGPGLGGDAEIGYRLKSVLQAMRCREVPVKPAILASEVLNRPLIVVGTPEYNIVAKSVEMALPVEERVGKDSPGPGRGMINVVKEPLGKMGMGGRDSNQASQLGYYFGACPEALYIAGPDDEGTRAAVYDLILRIWGSDSKFN